MNKNLVACFLLLSAVSCVNYSYTPDVVSRSDAQKQQYVVLGTIKDITTVTIEGDREAGAAAGALILSEVSQEKMLLNLKLNLILHL